MELRDKGREGKEREWADPGRRDGDFPWASLNTPPSSEQPLTCPWENLLLHLLFNFSLFISPSLDLALPTSYCSCDSSLPWPSQTCYGLTVPQSCGVVLPICSPEYSHQAPHPSLPLTFPLKKLHPEIAPGNPPGFCFSNSEKWTGDSSLISNWRQHSDG